MRYLTVLGEKKRIPAYPHHKDFAYRKRQLLNAKTLLSFLTLSRFRALKESYNCYRYRCAIPRELLIDPTNACNLQCKGCWAGDYDNSDNLSYEKLDAVVSEAKELGVQDILMTGGEPLLRKQDILKLASRHRDLFFAAFTNGTLIDEALVRQMVELQNFSVFISIEGFEHDNTFRRGRESFSQAVRSMNLLKAHDISYGFSICYHKQNFERVASEEFLDFLRAQGAWYGWAFSYRPIGKDADVGLCLDAEERAYVHRLFDHYRRKHDFTVVDMFNDGHKVYGCVAAGNGYLHINARGDVEPCAFCHYSDSNIHEVSLKEALRSPFFRAFRKNQPYTRNPLRPCPMMDAPDSLIDIVEQTGAASTHPSAPESIRDHSAKVKHLAGAWEKVAEREYGNYSARQKRKHRALVKYLSIKKRLSGDA